VLELASLAEALAGLVADKAITPATMGQTLAGYVRARSWARRAGSRHWARTASSRSPSARRST
jgi:hypothetical protein